MQVAKKALWQIEEEHYTLLRLIEDNDGELTPELEDALGFNELEMENKAISIGFLIKRIDNEVEQAKAMAKQAKEYAEKKEKARDAFKEKLSEAMQLFGLHKVELPTLKLSFRKSESVEIIDEKTLPSECMRIKTIVEPDKTKIKDLLKEGHRLEGARLVEKNNLIIK